MARRDSDDWKTEKWNESVSGVYSSVSGLLNGWEIYHHQSNIML